MTTLPELLNARHTEPSAVRCRWTPPTSKSGPYEAVVGNQKVKGHLFCSILAATPAHMSKKLTKRGRVDDTRQTGEYEGDHGMNLGESEEGARGDPEEWGERDIVEAVTPPIDAVAEDRGHDHLGS